MAQTNDPSTWILSPDPAVVERQALLKQLGIDDDPNLSTGELRERTAYGSRADRAVSADVARDIKGGLNNLGDARWVKKGDLVVNVLDYGAKGDGVTDDTSAINAALASAPGRTIVLPSGRNYLIHADAGTPSTGHGGGLVINQPRTTLDLRGATLTMIPSSSQWYQMIDVVAADCTILGGRIIGDVDTHIGATGEFGYGISIGAGAHRTRVRDCYITKCWGDGFFLWEACQDVELAGCVADNNRRQGLSIIDAIRPRVIGGAYKFTGATAYTAPGGGICIEPDAATTRNVIDALIVGVQINNNAGPGLLGVANGRTLSGLVIGCIAKGNGFGAGAALTSGLYFSGASTLRIEACTADTNLGHGFEYDSNTAGLMLTNAASVSNGGHGISIAGTDIALLSCSASLNQLSGINTTSAAARTRIVGGTTRSNNQSAVGYHNVDNAGINTVVTSHVSDAGALSTVPAFGYLNRSTATGARYIGCDAFGAYAGGAYLDQTTGTVAVTLPKPGAARPAAIPSPSSDTSGTKAAIDAIRSALVNLGLTAP